MGDMSIYADRSEELQRAGFNCCQSLIGCMCEELGAGRDLAFRFAAEFGSGIGKSGEICGAVSGALMLIGLKYGMTDPDRSHTLAHEYIRRFREKHAGCIHCSELLGANPGTEEGMTHIRDHNLNDTRCRQLIRDGADLVSSLLMKDEAGSRSGERESHRE